ncbi:MAG: cupin domain-containing protein [Dehalococcoidia bacterium]
MTNPVAVTQLAGKSHDSPDETRTPPKTRVEVVHLEGFTVGRFNFEPGWRWSEHIKPVVGTDSCQLSHVGYVVEGTMGIRLNDGSERTFTAGDSYTIPPGHDGWVIGDAPVVALEVMSADQFAKA